MNVDKAFWRAIVLTIPITLASCTDNRNDTKCSDVYTSRLDPHGFDHLEGGITRHKSSGLIFTRCAVGQRLINFKCVGSPSNSTGMTRRVTCVKSPRSLASGGGCQLEPRCWKSLRASVLTRPLIRTSSPIWKSLTFGLVLRE